MDTAVYVMEKFPLVVDPSGQATRFLKYQRGTMLMVANPTDMAPDSLRRHLVGALKHGSLLIINFDTLVTLELEQFFASDSFPREVYSRQQLFSPEVFGKLLRLSEGDPEATEFIINDHFKLVVLCRSETPPPATAKEMCVIHETKRNSTELVEAAFDNELATVVSCLDKNYDIEKRGADPNKCNDENRSPLYRAAYNGHVETIQLLLESGGVVSCLDKNYDIEMRGADPNKCNDENRSPLYRAAYNGHVETIQLLLESGGDPRLRSKQGETAFDVAKNAETQALLAEWDLSKTDKLVDERRKVIEAKWQERITNHVEREQFALMQIHSELLEIAREGNVEALKKRLEQLADEALETGERPRACADIRDEKGSTLLALAAQFDHVEMVLLLVSKGKTLEAKKCLRVLLDNGADPNLKNQYNKNAYYFAKDDLDAANNIVKSKAEIRQVLIDWENDGWTPVSLAVFHEAKKCLRVLLDNGADPNLKNQYNKNAYYFAKDDLDAANNIVKSKAEIRQVLIDWENEHRPAAVTPISTSPPKREVKPQENNQQVLKERIKYDCSNFGKHF
ncbi:TKL protein kinase [Phytophthora palmivora]|uniref:TKL protein kinase n=1 Tax=Phytophthora palmivora TaxID=4796 RepID=A0A2P4WYR5_9STRA|nr:TKL protein kinase [Phytophthora palmivora]